MSTEYYTKGFIRVRRSIFVRVTYRKAVSGAAGDALLEPMPSPDTLFQKQVGSVSGIFLTRNCWNYSSVDCQLDAGGSVFHDVIPVVLKLNRVLRFSPTIPWIYAVAKKPGGQD